MISIATTEDDGRFHHYAGVIEDARFKWKGTLKKPYDESNLAGIDALIVSCDNHLANRIAIAACGKLGIPVFHILDGVVDWRTTFENTKYKAEHGGTPLFQPLIADYVFTLGPLQQLQMNRLGNSNALATGLPRLDSIARRPCRVGPAEKTPSLLVATANTPWANDEQRKQLIDSFHHLATHIQNKDIHATYRISQELAENSGTTADSTGSAIEALNKCDALITTPSTFAVEAMLSGVPTLIFDPFALPVFTPSAWMATSWQSVISSIPSLLSPTQPLADYQDDLCHSIAIGDGGATLRVADKIASVIGNYKPEEPRHASASRPGAEQRILGLSTTLSALEARLHEAQQ